jgi:hypothetical protein
MEILIFVDKLTNEIWRAFAWDRSFCVRDQAVSRVRKSGVPTGIGTAVVQLIIYVPTKNAIAKTTTMGHQAFEFREVHELSPYDPVNVSQTQDHLFNSSISVRSHTRIKRFVHTNTPSQASELV